MRTRRLVPLLAAAAYRAGRPDRGLGRRPATARDEAAHGRACSPTARTWSPAVTRSSGRPAGDGSTRRRSRSRVGEQDVTDAVRGPPERSVRGARHRARAGHERRAGHRSRVRRAAPSSPTTPTAARSSPARSSTPYQCQETAIDAQCNEPATYDLPLQVDRPDEAGPAALRPGQPAVRRRDHDHRRGRRGAVHRAAGEGLPGPRPLHDPHAVQARQDVGAVARRRSSGTTRC